MPTTGAVARLRAASSPVSSKQAMTWPATPRASPRAISCSRPGTARAPSTQPSIEAGPVSGLTAVTRVPGAAAAAAAAPILAVMPAVVFGLTTRISIDHTSPLPASVPWRVRRRRSSAIRPSAVSTTASDTAVVTVPSA